MTSVVPLLETKQFLMHIWVERNHSRKSDEMSKYVTRDKNNILNYNYSRY